MLLRRAVATLAALTTLAATGALSGCDDASPAATGGEPDAAATAPAADSAYPTYVALGDSYTAAPGVPDTEQESGCQRSDGNYPSLVAAELRREHDTTSVDVSCSGASTLSLVGSQQTSQGIAPPQFEALRPDTSLVTLGIGGNDLDLFSTLIGVCAQLAFQDGAGAPCRDYMAENGEEGDLMLEKVDAISTRVASALDGVRDRSPEAEVILVGYPQPVPARGRCPILPLAEGDYRYVRSVVTALGAGLERAARRAGADYVDLIGPSEGHDICAGEDAWVNGLATDERALAFHPFAEMQEAVAELVLAELDRS